MHPPFQEGTVLLHERAAQKWLLFERPRRILTARSVTEVVPLLRQIEEEVERNHSFAAGFVSYEAAPAFDPALRVATRSGFPLAWFGIYEKPVELDSLDLLERNKVPTEPLDWSFPSSQQEYAAAVERIKGYIQSGDTYQVNYSLRLQAAFAGDPWSLFTQVVKAQGPNYSAFINMDEWCICSASPELFFRLDQTKLVCRPMKGTSARGLWPAQDTRCTDQLLHSEKNRAENLMIVDMVRNDLGRVAQSGSVRVDRLFELEKYPTLWQMTSSVGCATTAPVTEIFRALFPAASITGAPKVRTTQLIAELEPSPRRIYTGAIGYFGPARQAQFNVAIRTVLVDKVSQTAEYGIGSGIVWDSDPYQEFQECRLKMGILAKQPPEFDLLETILWKPASGFFLLEEHLSRLTESADYFGRPVCLETIRQRLAELERHLPPLAHRVRLRVDEHGNISLEHGVLEPAEAQSSRAYRLTLASTPIDSSDPLLYHKTTHRKIFEQARAACPDFDDLLLWNEHEELTESTIANLVVEKDGQLLTPPVRCGLLPGVYRAHLLEQRRIREQPIRVDDLQNCSRIFLINSVREMWEAMLAPAAAAALHPSLTNP